MAHFKVRATREKWCGNKTNGARFPWEGGADGTEISKWLSEKKMKQKTEGEREREGGVLLLWRHSFVAVAAAAMINLSRFGAAAETHLAQMEWVAATAARRTRRPKVATLEIRVINIQRNVVSLSTAVKTLTLDVDYANLKSVETLGTVRHVAVSPTPFVPDVSVLIKINLSKCHAIFLLSPSFYCVNCNWEKKKFEDSTIS